MQFMKIHVCEQVILKLHLLSKDRLKWAYSFISRPKSYHGLYKCAAGPYFDLPVSDFLTYPLSKSTPRYFLSPVRAVRAPHSFQSQFHFTMSSALGNKEVRLPMLPNAFQPTEEINRTSVGEDISLGQGFHDVVSSCAGCLASGGVIAVPTDTIYGVACLAQNSEAVNLLYEIKQRNYKNPVAISVARIDDIYRWSKVTVPRQVLEDLLPGPVTVVFERSAELNPALNPHTHLVGIRIPGHNFMQDLAKECGSPVALTSANISGASSCLRIEEFDSLWPHLNLVVNGGVLSDSNESRLGSTVVDLSVPGTFRIIRPGSAQESTTTCLVEKHQLKETSETPIR